MNNKICVSVGEMLFLDCLKIASTRPLIELRLDLLELSPEKIDLLAMQCRQWVATCRPGNLTERERTVLLAAAIRAGATYVDIEYEAETNYRKALIELAQRCYCKIIISYHNFDETPSQTALREIINQSKTMGADYVKLALTANSPVDCARIMSLYENHSNIIAFAMGEIGKITRIAAPYLGAQFTFASVDEAGKTAPGQLAAPEMEMIFNILNTYGQQNDG